MKHFSTTLLHTAWTEDEKIALDDALFFVENYQGPDFLSDISTFLFERLKTNYLTIAFVTNPTNKILQSVVLLENGHHITNQLFKLEGTPFGMALENDFCYYPFCLQDIFPEDKLLKKVGAESFLGKSLYNKQEEQMGIIALMHNRIIERGGFVEALLNAIIPQIENELFYSINIQEVN